MCIQCMHYYLTLMLSAYASSRDSYAQFPHLFLMRMLSVYKMNIFKMGKTAAHAELRVRISS
jgi:hypothetical protein